MQFSISLRCLGVFCLIICLIQFASSVQREVLEDTIASVFSNGNILWENKLRNKLLCCRQKKVAIYLYHHRKAAGTTVRELLKQSAIKFDIPFYETEGISLSQDFTKLYIYNHHKYSGSSLLTVTSFRHPIERIVSLYWYEHVAWFDEVLHTPDKIQTFDHWVDAWSDGHTWKTQYMKKNPYTNYVEVENYYIKSLIGWNGESIDYTRALTKAKQVLEQFDIIFISEWLKNVTESRLLMELLELDSKDATNNVLVESNKGARTRLQHRLMKAKVSDGW